MTSEITRQRPARPARRRRWPRRLLIGVAALLALIVLATWAFIKFQPTLPPLALPGTAAQAPACRWRAPGPSPPAPRASGWPRPPSG